MPIDVYFDPATRILHGRITGTPTPDDLVESFERIRVVGDIPLDADMVWDLRTMDFPSLTIELLRDIVRRRKQFNAYRSESATAYVVIGEPEERMIRLMIAVSVGVKRREAIFHSMNDAMDWLGAARREVRGSIKA